MSWIVTGVGGGLALTSTALSIAGNAKEQAAINAARSNEVAAQAGLQQRSNAIANQSIAKSTAPVARGQIDAGAAQRTALYNVLQKASVPIAAANPVSGAGSARSAGTGTAWSNLVAGNQAQAGGYSDWENQQNIKNADASQKLGIINSFSRGTAGLLPIQLQVAGQAGDQLSGWGSIVGALGSAASAYGVSRMWTAPNSALTSASQSASQSAQVANEFQNGAGAAPMTAIDWANLKG